MKTLLVNAIRPESSSQIQDNVKRRLEEYIGSLYLMGYPSTQLLITSLLRGKKCLDRRIMVVCSIGACMEILEELL
jgi:hypothetical protein